MVGTTRRRGKGPISASLFAGTLALAPACADPPEEAAESEAETSPLGDIDAESEADDGETATAGDGDGDSDATDEETGDGDGDGDGEPVDCANLPLPVVTPLDGPVGSAGLAFDSSGNMLGSDTQSLFVSNYESGPATLFVPGIGGRGHMVLLPSGDLAMITGWEEEVTIVHPDGSADTPMAWFDKPYGMALDQNGMLLVADNNRLYRLDPSNWNAETLLTSQDIPRPRVLAFDADYGSIFVGMESAQDTIFRVYFDDQGQLQEPIAWAWLGGVSQPWVDGIAVDECGNVYVAEYWDHTLYRIGPEGGQAEVLVDWPEVEYGHAVVWGSGVDGWKDTALYLPQPYNSNYVAEVDLGVRSIHPLLP